LQTQQSEFNKSIFEMDWDEDTIEVKPISKNVIDEWD